MNNIKLESEIHIGEAGSKTFCNDTKTCRELNEFLNDSEKINFPFSVDFTGGRCSLSMDITNMSKYEILKLNQRVMNFVMRELEIIENGD